jgi:hypothetical protein
VGCYLACDLVHIILRPVSITLPNFGFEEIESDELTLQAHYKQAAQ